MTDIFGQSNNFWVLLTQGEISQKKIDNFDIVSQIGNWKFLTLFSIAVRICTT